MGSLAGCGSAGATITRLAVGDPGQDAYTLVSGVDDEKVTRRAEAGGDQQGDAPGLYGGTRKATICDKAALIEFLQANPAKAKAWASVHKIDPTAIPTFVNATTAVQLRVDTLVTNHGFRSGDATRIPAVLQAGVAVLVDAHGAPVVKCNCGNPLTAPDKEIKVQNSSYTGKEWPQFAKDKVTVINPKPEEITTLMLVDSDMGMAYGRPIGTDGEQDTTLVAIPPEAMPETTGSPAPTGTLPSDDGSSPGEGGQTTEPGVEPEPTTELPEPEPEVTPEVTPQSSVEQEPVTEEPAPEQPPETTVAEETQISQPSVEEQPEPGPS